MGLMPRPYPRSFADHPGREPSFLSFLLYLRSSPFPSSLFPPQSTHPSPPQSASPPTRTPLRRLKHAVDKNQVCRVRQGARVRSKSAREGATTGVNDRKGKKSSRECHFHSSSFFPPSLPSSPPFRPVSLSTIRYISTHPQHCFRGISSELFARDSFRAARRLILLLCLFPSLRDRDVTKLARTRPRIQLVSYAPFLDYQNKLNGSVKLREIIKYGRDKKYD